MNEDLSKRKERGKKRDIKDTWKKPVKSWNKNKEEKQKEP